MKTLKSKALLYDDMKAYVLFGLSGFNKVTIKSTKNGRYVVIWKSPKPSMKNVDIIKGERCCTRIAKLRHKLIKKGIRIYGKISKSNH